MAFSNRKGKGNAGYGPWSDYLWDDEGCYQWRYNPSGAVEYYRHPPTSDSTAERNTLPPTQTSAESPEVPRFTGEDHSYAAGENAQVDTGETSTTYITSSARPTYNPPYQPLSDSSVPASSPKYYPEDKRSPGTVKYFNSSVSSNVPSAEPSTTFDSSVSTSAAGSASDFQNSPGTATSISSVPVSYSFAGTLSGPNYASPACLLSGFSSLSLSKVPEQAPFETSRNNPSEGVSYIRRTPGSQDYEDLDPRYKEVKDQGKFWKVGRVFMMLWTEPARAAGGQSRDGTHFSSTYLNGTAFSEIRRFVVIKVGYGSNICSPIHTYGGQATLKPNLPERQKHAIIHTTETPPDEKWYYATDRSVVQENLIKDPIRVRREQRGPEGDLGVTSRINYSKIYTVENYVRVLNIGMVHPNSMQSLINNSYLKEVHDPPERPTDFPPRATSSRADSSTDEYQGGSGSREYVKGSSKDGKRRSRR